MAFHPNTAYLIGQRIGYSQNNHMNVGILSVVFQWLECKLC